jgi:hypothetical protein
MLMESGKVFEVEKKSFSPVLPGVVLVVLSFARHSFVAIFTQRAVLRTLQSLLCSSAPPPS